MEEVGQIGKTAKQAWNYLALGETSEMALVDLVIDVLVMWMFVRRSLLLDGTMIRQLSLLHLRDLALAPSRTSLD
jgi:hypothetical protein